MFVLAGVFGHGRTEMGGRCLGHRHWKPSDSFLPSKPDQQTTHGRAHVPGDGNFPAAEHTHSIIVGIEV